ncbi:hypothetical protein AHAS_Ahas12G0176600 [Arachis hypogaea]
MPLRTTGTPPSNASAPPWNPSMILISRSHSNAQLAWRRHTRVNGGGEVLVADGDGDDRDSGQEEKDADGEPRVCSGDVGADVGDAGVLEGDNEINGGVGESLEDSGLES